MNPQIRFGEDLMSRVSYVMMNPGGEAELTTAVRDALADHPAYDRIGWEAPVASAQQAFRNKAKMVVSGSVDAPVLGIWDPRTGGTDLRGCPLYSEAVHGLLEVLAGFVTTAGLTPYDVGDRRGELKHVLVTESPDGEHLVRLVLRSTEALPRGRDAQTNLDPSDCQDVVQDTDNGGAAFIPTPSGPDQGFEGDCLNNEQQ